jgi:hypothetical protein
MEAISALIHPRWTRQVRSTRLSKRRERIAAQFIPPGSRVLDLGCGAMTLRHVISADCSYTPCDILPHHPDIVVANLNLLQFPPGEYDVAMMLGVVEYLENPLWVFRAARSRCNRLVFGYERYRFWTAKNIAACEKHGRMNYLREPELMHFLKLSGWRVDHIEHTTRWHKRLKRFSRIYVCS